MPSVTGTSEWDNDYARVARVASQLRTQGLQSSSSSSSVVVRDQQQQQQQQLQNHLIRLDDALSTLPLSAMEIQRRRRLLQHLANQQPPPLNYNNQYYSVGTGSSSIVGGGTGSVGMNYHHFGASSEAGGSSIAIGGLRTTGGSGQQQQQMGSSMMSIARRKQDDMIDELAVGVGRLRDQTQIIGDEARLHVRLLNDLETNLDAAHTGLDAETKRAAKLREDTSVWRLQLIIVGQVVLFILLLLQGIS